MNIIQLITNFTNNFNETFGINITPFNLEEKIRNIGDEFTKQLYEEYLSQLDEKFKCSIERLQKYYVKETKKDRKLVSTIGEISFQSTRYVDKLTNKCYCFINDVLALKPYQRFTNEAEHTLVAYAMENNMSQSAKSALRNVIVSRSTVSRKVKNLKGSPKENITKTDKQPDVLYIEIDEIHANLQFGGNRICPCAIVHEGYKDNNAIRKELLNVHYFASAYLTYEELTNVIYDYVDKKYDIDKFKVIFVSGDGLIAKQNLHKIFPNSKFVLDPFHYQCKYLNCIFKNNTYLKSIADNYIRNNQIDEFNALVKYQIEQYPEEANQIRKKAKYITNNVEYIINQKDELYVCHCSMEGHVNHGFARYITSSPFGFSLEGLNNKLKLLVHFKNYHELTIEDYLNMKYGKDSYEEVNDNINKLLNVEIDKNIFKKHNQDVSINVSMPILTSGTNIGYLIKGISSLKNSI